MLNYDDLQKKPRVFLSVTSVTIVEFQVLLVAFAQAVEEVSHLTAEGKPRKRKQGGGQIGGKLPRMEDKLLFILSYIKNYPLQTYQGLQFGLSQPKTNVQIHSLLPKLKRALEILGCQPARTAEDLVERLKNQIEVGELVQDGVERMRARPLDEEAQKLYYSGKKRHIRKRI